MSLDWMSPEDRKAMDALYHEEKELFLQEGLQAFGQKDHEAVRRASHRLKGSALTLEDDPVAEAALSLETWAKDQGDWAEGESLLLALKSLVES